LAGSAFDDSLTFVLLLAGRKHAMHWRVKESFHGRP
jgi:hypothetical protein